jgi:hypothetical protein
MPALAFFHQAGHDCFEKPVLTMKRLLAIVFLLLSTYDVHAKEQHVPCPGDTTVDIRGCDSFLLDQSDLKLKRLAGKDTRPGRKLEIDCATKPLVTGRARFGRSCYFNAIPASMKP